MGPLPDRQTGLFRQLGEPGSAGSESLRQRLTLGRDARMQLERAILDLYVVITLEQVDPSLADIAERSDVVAVDGDLRGHEDPPPLHVIPTSPSAGPG
jgi:hypothetical protein